MPDLEEFLLAHAWALHFDQQVLAQKLLRQARKENPTIKTALFILAYGASLVVPSPGRY